MSATVRVKRFIIIEVSVKRESTVMWNDKSKLITVGAWRANILIFFSRKHVWKTYWLSFEGQKLMEDHKPLSQ